MKFNTIFFLIICLVLGTVKTDAQQAEGYKIIAYYTGSGDKIQAYPVEKLTHIIYSFLKIKEDTLTVANEKQEKSLKTQAPYQYSSSKKLFAIFDNERSIEAKSKFIKNTKLGGMMFWELSEDKEQGGLLDAIYMSLKI